MLVDGICLDVSQSLRFGENVNSRIVYFSIFVTIVFFMGELGLVFVVLTSPVVFLNESSDYKVTLKILVTLHYFLKKMPYTFGLL